MKKTLDCAGLRPFSILQIGHGSLGVHLASHMQDQVEQYTVTSTRYLKDLDLEPFEYIFLAVNDSSLQELISGLRFQSPNSKLVHFSGFNHFKNALGLHPVASFNRESKYSLDEITFVADGEIDEKLKPFFKKVQMISPEKKQDYHNFLSVSANAVQLMMHNLGNDFNSLVGLDSNLLKDIVLHSLRGEQEQGAKSFSGPWIRNEKVRQDETVELMPSASLKNLNEHFKKEIEIYKNKENKHECS